MSLAMTLSTLWSLHAESQGFLLSPDKLDWQQPSSMSESFPELISAHHWQFNYEATEKILLKMKQKKTGELVFNENTAKVLKQAVSELPIKMEKDELQRVEFLVTKGFPGKTGQQLAIVLTQFYHFQQASNIAHSSINIKKNKHNKELSFQQTVLRQERYLGKDMTRQLFGRQNALTHYLYARQHINENSNLNQIQKQQQLTALKNRFKTHVR